jgi:hypothetical protein
MTFSTYPFDVKPADGFRDILLQIRGRAWEKRAEILREENSQPELRAILCRFFAESFLEQIDSALHGDLLVAYAQPLILIADFDSAGGRVMNYPICWQKLPKAMRLTEYLMHKVDYAYRNDPRLSPERIQQRRDISLLRLALARNLANFDGATYCHIRTKIKPIVSDFIDRREMYINRAIRQNSLVGIAPPL